MDAEDIAHLLLYRRKARAPLMEKAREIKAQYEGDIHVPLPELASGERVAVANLINQGIDAHAQRIASVVPDLYCPSAKPGVKREEKNARKRRKAILGWWEHNGLDLKLNRRSRWLIAYGTTPVLIRPGMDGIPKWHLRSPLETYPAPTSQHDDITPADCIFNFHRSRDWCKRNYNIHAGDFTYLGSMERKKDQMVSLVEYVDDKEFVLLAMGECNSADYSQGGYDLYPTISLDGRRHWYLELERLPNRTGLCPAVVANRLSLEGPIGQFDQMIGLFQQQALLMAMEVHAVRNSVWPKTWLIGRPNEVPTIAQMADGPAGVVGIVTGGELQDKTAQPGFQTYPTIDRLERAQRLAGGIPAEFGGESASNIRTGRRGQDVLSAVVDFPILEAHKLLAHSLKEEDVRAIAMAKSYAGNQSKSFYVSWRGAKGVVDYTPNDIFDVTYHEVRYPHVGADANGLVIAGGQRIGLGTMSKESFMEIDPYIDDPEKEKDRVLTEQIDAGILAEFGMPGTAPLRDKARVKQLILSTGMDLAEAILKAQEEAQERQSTDVNPVPPGAPEAQPGLSPAGQGAEAGTQIQEPTPDMQNMASLLASLFPADQAMRRG